MTSGIYAIYSKTQPRAYIGQAVNVERRWKRHLYELKTNTHHTNFLQNYYNKHGENDLEFILLTEIEQPELLCKEEQKQIDGHERLGFQLFNSKLASDQQAAAAAHKALCREFKHADSTKKAISAALVKRWASMSELERKAGAAMASAARVGTKHSQESLAKMSDSLKGRKLSPEHAATSAEHLRSISHKRFVPVSVSGNGLVDVIFPSQKEAATTLGVNRGNIQLVLSGKRTHTKGYTFRYVT